MTPPDSTIKSNQQFLRLYYQYGKVVGTNNFTKGDNKAGHPLGNFNAASLQLGWQTKGTKLWQQIWALPNYGAGFYYTNLRNLEEVGYTAAVYGFFNGPFFRSGAFTLNYDVQFGLAYFSEPYHHTDNPYNYAIGSPLTVYFNPGLLLNWRINNRFEADFGGSLTHFSNGAVTLPNLGLNAYAMRLALRYSFKPVEINYVKPTIPKFNKLWEFSAGLALAYKEMFIILDTLDDYSKVEETLGMGIVCINTFFQRQFGHKFKAGVGLDFSYDPSIVAQTYVYNGEIDPDRASNMDKLAVGANVGIEIVAHRLSVLMQAGYYILRKEFEGQRPSAYQRVGLKYHFTDHMYAGVNIRAFNFSVADYIEWTIGYRIQWRGKGK